MRWQPSPADIISSSRHCVETLATLRAISALVNTAAGQFHRTIWARMQKSLRQKTTAYKNGAEQSEGRLLASQASARLHGADAPVAYRSGRRRLEGREESGRGLWRLCCLLSRT